MKKPPPTPLDAPPDARATRFKAGDEELVVLSFSLPELERLQSLTQAEREVAEELLKGRSSAEIARARRRSPNTVANQVASIFKKLQVNSRAELAAAILRGLR